jgi:hemerythrin
MVGTHIFGNPEIDLQHEVIFAQVRSLQEVLADKEQLHVIRPTLKRLRELLIAHFKVEQSFMDEHRQKHEDILGLLDQCLASTSIAGEAGQLEQVLEDNQSGHSGGGGPRIADGINALVDSVRTHELQNPTIAW